MNEMEPELFRSVWGEVMIALSSNFNASGVRSVNARQNLDQRRLTGAVLSDEPVDRPGLYVEIGSCERAHPSKALHDFAHRQQRFLAI